MSKPRRRSTNRCPRLQVLEILQVSSGCSVSAELEVVMDYHQTCWRIPQTPVLSRVSLLDWVQDLSKGKCSRWSFYYSMLTYHSGLFQKILIFLQSQYFDRLINCQVPEFTGVGQIWSIDRFFVNSYGAQSQIWSKDRMPDRWTIWMSDNKRVCKLALSKLMIPSYQNSS